MTDHQPIAPPSIADSVIELCNLVAHAPDISAVHFIPARRPTLLDIQSGCDLARQNNLQLTIESDGALVVRGTPTPEAMGRRWHPHLKRLAWP